MPTQHEPWADTELSAAHASPHPPSVPPTGTSSSSRSTRLQPHSACARRAAARSLRPKLRCCGSSSGTRGLMAASYHANGCTSRGWLSRRRVPQSTWCNALHRPTTSSPHACSVGICRLQVVGETEVLTPADCAFLQSRHSCQELLRSRWFNFNAVHAAQQRVPQMPQIPQQVQQMQRVPQVPLIQRVQPQPQRLHELQTQQSQAQKSRLTPALCGAGGAGSVSKLSVPPAVLTGVVRTKWSFSPGAPRPGPRWSL